MRKLWIAGMAALAMIGPVAARDNPFRPRVEVALCLDTSNSMDGLINSAKQKLWDIVNDLAQAKPTPELRVALYSYGNVGYDPRTGWVRKELDLSSDLDEVYRKLTGLRTHGGDEYVARVCRDALRDLRWSRDDWRGKPLRLIFVCGNEPASQDPEVKLSTVAALAKERGAIINCIYCGGVNDSDAADWKEFAAMAGGRFANIDQDKGSLAIATPYDKEMGELSSSLNRTYCAYGAMGQAKCENQTRQDANATAASPAANASRSVTKAGALYNCADWDLVDKLKADPKFDPATMPESELPDEMKKLKPEERLAYLKGKLAEREAIQAKIQDLNKKREEYVRGERAKVKAPETGLDSVLRSILREQAKANGIAIP